MGDIADEHREAWESYTTPSGFDRSQEYEIPDMSRYSVSKPWQYRNIETGEIVTAYFGLWNWVVNCGDGRNLRVSPQDFRSSYNLSEVLEDKKNWDSLQDEYEDIKAWGAFDYGLPEMTDF